MKIQQLTLAVGLLTVSGLASADITNGPDPYAAGFGFDKPHEAAWGGWTRGDTGTLHAEWDSFTDASYGTATDRTAAPDVGSSGVTSPYLSWNAGTFRAGSGNLYSFTVNEDFDVDVTASSTGTGPITAALQLETAGNPLQPASLLLNGIAPASVTKTYTDPAYPSSFGAVTLDQWQVLWDLPTASAAYHFDFGAEIHTAMAQVAVDIGPAAVPLPAAVWMFGAGLMGMLGLNRKKIYSA